MEIKIEKTQNSLTLLSMTGFIHTYIRTYCGEIVDICKFPKIIFILVFLLISLLTFKAVYIYICVCVCISLSIDFVGYLDNMCLTVRLVYTRIMYLSSRGYRYHFVVNNYHGL